MSVIDLIIRFDSDFCFSGMQAFGGAQHWLDPHFADNAWGKKPELIFGAPLREAVGTVELNARFYRYQWESEPQGHTLFLSQEGVLLDLYEQALNHVSEGIQIYDRNGYFIFANPASEALEHYESSDFKGKHILDLYDLREEFSTVLTVLRTQKPVLNRCDRFQVRQGKTLTTINSGYPLCNGKTMNGAVVFESDLSVLEQTRKRLSHLESYAESRRPAQAGDLFTFDDIIHQSEAMRDLIHFAKKISFTESSILVMGETGTGKELIAQSIHAFSPRRRKPFIDVNCSAVPSNLFESLFFGTEKGAFTGSISSKGYFEMADGGTIFLDEVNSIPPDMQAKLLRVLQDKRFQRIGGNRYHQCDVRIIAASNEDLSELMEQNRIRRDFYYRISTMKIDLPRLEERPEDIPLLAVHFLGTLGQKYNRHTLRFSEATLAHLTACQWPGNIRELQHVVEYAFTRMPEESDCIEPVHLPGYLTAPEGYSCRRKEILPLKAVALKPAGPLNPQLEAFEKDLITAALKFHEGNITHTAKSLGMSRQNLQYRLRKHSLSD